MLDFAKYNSKYIRGGMNLVHYQYPNIAINVGYNALSFKNANIAIIIFVIIVMLIKYFVIAYMGYVNLIIIKMTKIA